MCEPQVGDIVLFKQYRCCGVQYNGHSDKLDERGRGRIIKIRGSSPIYYIRHLDRGTAHCPIFSHQRECFWLLSVAYKDYLVHVNSLVGVIDAGSESW